ncbi:MFS transporter [Alteribacillus iranensis]|uniref:MFS transporter, DHA1 family, multidrug resistance protein n=1 Tax=Alteribacillus iranensis TaxID=930128 RepID=A0A1I2ACA3_9BACI|nr:MFS transporter [Alteribacillus iranensis]SFE41654.1 MFS transporter, DHA1 family, multidrug resistance protein [Alteribacillus iranensis]
MEDWKKNLYILTASVFIVMSGMTMIIPFLPLYLQELGVTGHREVTIWAGLITGINFFSAFLVSPLWGRLADKHGRRLMVLRSGFGMAIVMVLMGFATGPWSLFFFRLLNGTISGFNPASIALVSTNTPKQHVGYALGILQAGSVAGTISGPLFGGLMAEVFGFRTIFNITGLFVAIAAVTVLLFVKEDFTRPETEEKTSTWQDFKKVAAIQPIPFIFVLVFIIQFSLIGLNPMVSLLVDELSGGTNSAFFAGLAVSVMGFANMTASPKLGKLTDRKGAQYVLFGSLIGAAVFSIPQAFVTELWQLIVMRFLVGLCLGGLLPAANTLIRKLSPNGMESRTYGFSNSFLFLGSMFGSMAGGLIASAVGIRGLFLIAALLQVIGVFIIYYRVIPKLREKRGCSSG